MRNSVGLQRGLTYVEMLLTVGITAVIVVALMGVVNTATETGREVMERNSLTRQARFAMTRMVATLGHSDRLLLPLRDNPAPDWPSVATMREQTVPASAPLGSSKLASAVLAVTLPRHVDLDGDGIADADNDGDGRFDEDLPGDSQNDLFAGVALVDDDGDGDTDEGEEKDDDEDGRHDEDLLSGVDDDGDGSVDEDPKDDNNKDDEAGLAGVDDDGDGDIDEGDKKDDDEDGAKDEDWYDPVVFSLQAGTAGQMSLVERTPVPWDANNDAIFDGRDFVESELATGVTHFRVERIQGTDLIDITLTLTDARSGETVSLQTRVRVGGAL